ncbi:GyrI-like domain-containing protein [bacterium]|nr:GyrI-like domain-containing protein [bacterium]
MNGRFLMTLLLVFMAAGLFAQEAENTEPVVKAAEVVVKTIEPYAYVAVEMKGSYEQHAQAFGTLYEQSAYQGLALNDIPFGIYWNDPNNTPEDSLRWEIGVAAPDADSVAAPLSIKKWPHAMIAVRSYEGPMEGEAFSATIGGLYGWIMQNGYQISGPIMERYMNMPYQDENDVWIGQLEIVLPVTKND